MNAQSTSKFPESEHYTMKKVYGNFATLSKLRERFDIKNVLVNSQIWFNGKEVGEMLEYKEPGRACRDHVKDKHKAYLRQLVDSSELSQWERNSVYISEAGLWMF